MRTVRIVAWAAVAALAIGGIAAIAMFPDRIGLTQRLGSVIGGPFSMTTHDGVRLTDRDLRGKPFAIFFGFTQCPDVCPTTMLEVAQLMEKLGPAADRMRFLFVTVDPERDTPDLLRDYLSSFDKRIIGLHGTEAETAAIVRAYRVYVSRVPTKESYTINHTATMYLMNAEGRLARTLAFAEDERTRLRKLQDLLGLPADPPAAAR